MAETFAAKTRVDGRRTGPNARPLPAGGPGTTDGPSCRLYRASCPHDDCDQQMQAIDFRLEDHGRSAHDPLVRDWWNDQGFAGRCPRCGGWIHFTIRGKTAITAEQAAGYLQLPDDWHAKATIL